MAYRQLKTPKLSVPAVRGWCLGYVDDAVNAPKRQPTATAAYNVEKRNGNIKTSALPTGHWVPIFFSLDAGPYRGLGHVAWAFNHGNGWIEIHDSETRAGARAVYRNIGEVLRWFSLHGIRYLGWSTWVDGAHIVEYYKPAPKPSTGRIKAKGTAMVIVPTVNVRSSPKASGKVVATYSKWQRFVYDSYQVANGYVWLSYVSYSGARRYVAEGPANGNPKDVYVTGGVSK